jgi:hypothetical protein
MHCGSVASIGNTVVVKRDLVHLRRVGDLFDADLKRAFGSEWAVTVTEGPILSVTNGQRTERVLFNDDVAMDNWPEEAWSDLYREHTLDDDASEALADELFEVLRLWSVPFPICSEHGQSRTDVCSMTWTCSGPPGHDLAQVGNLGA